MVKRRKKGKGRPAARRSRPSSLGLYVALPLLRRCCGLTARWAQTPRWRGRCVLLTRAAATRVLWWYARARGLKDSSDGRRLVLARDPLGGVLGVGSATISELPSSAPHLVSDGAAAAARATSAAAAAAPAPDEPPSCSRTAARSSRPRAAAARTAAGSQHAPPHARTAKAALRCLGDYTSPRAADCASACASAATRGWSSSSAVASFTSRARELIGAHLSAARAHDADGARAAEGGASRPRTEAAAPESEEAEFEEEDDGEDVDEENDEDGGDDDADEMTMTKSPCRRGACERGTSRVRR